MTNAEVIHHFLTIGIEVSDNDVTLARKLKKDRLPDDIYADDIYRLVSASNKKSMLYASSPILLHAHKRLCTSLSSNAAVKQPDDSLESHTESTVLRPSM